MHTIPNKLMVAFLDRKQIKFKPNSVRVSKTTVTDLKAINADPTPLDDQTEFLVADLVDKMQTAKQNGAPILIAYGAHLIKNGLGPLLIGLMKHGYAQHLLTNGAGSIHDWELAYQGETEENVRRYIESGQFGIWEQTCAYLNLAVLVGAAQNLGYGASVGRMIAEGGVRLPDPQALTQTIIRALQTGDLNPELACQTALLQAINEFQLPAGKTEIPHPHKAISVQYQAFQAGVPLSVCPGIGYDIIYSHPLNNGPAIGQGSLLDFLSFAHAVGRLEGGVFLSIGSAVMSPMVFEKAMSMAKNLALQENRPLANFRLIVNDIQPGSWDWRKGEPPKEHPAYYLRFCKSFSRMGGEFDYLMLDNQVLLQHLCQRLGILE